MMFNRKTRSFLPTINKQHGNTIIRAKRQARKDSVKRNYDKKSRKLTELDVDQSVFFQHLEGQNWKFGKVTNILGSSTYEVKGTDGGVYRRNRVHLRPTKVQQHSRDNSPIRASLDDKTKPHLATPSQKTFPDDKVKIKSPDSTKETNPLPRPTSNLAMDRPRRTIKPPTRYNDFITK